MRALQFPTGASWREVNLAEYRQHLEDLDGLVAACQTQRAKKQAAPANSDACDPRQIGQDDRVHWPAASSPIAGRALRLAARRIRKHENQQSGGGKPAGTCSQPEKQLRSSVDELLAQARQRLQGDEKQASSPAEAVPDFSAERKSLNTILARKAYQGVSEVSPRERFLEWLDNLLDKFLSSTDAPGLAAPWIGWVLRALLLVAICRALIWFLVRIERNARIRLVPDAEPAPGCSFGARVAIVAQGCAGNGGQAPVARGHSFSLLGVDRAAGIDALVARRPRAHAARISRPDGGADPRKTEP